MPMLKDVTHRWSGQVLDTIDYAGFVGKNPGSNYTYVSTGDSGQGLTHGAMGAILNATLVTGGESKWADLYVPERKPIKAAKNWVNENSTALKNFAEYVAPGEISSVEDLRLGEGAIVRRGLKKIAAYRDPQGHLHLCSAVCTHVGCHLQWNSFETCWDCPCHGSMFGTDGEPINAPAISALERLSPDD
jgi:Rieske Fe-S protein